MKTAFMENLTGFQINTSRLNCSSGLGRRRTAHAPTCARAKPNNILRDASDARSDASGMYTVSRQGQETEIFLTVSFKGKMITLLRTPRDSTIYCNVGITYLFDGR